MTQKNSIVGVEAIAHMLKPPKGAYAHIERFLRGRDINNATAAKDLGVNKSTITRLLGGGSLTEEMAAKLKSAYGLDPETLFNLEAQARTYKTEQLYKQLVA